MSLFSPSLPLAKLFFSPEYTVREKRKGGLLERVLSPSIHPLLFGSGDDDARKQVANLRRRHYFPEKRDGKIRKLRMMKNNFHTKKRWGGDAQIGLDVRREKRRGGGSKERREKRERAYSPETQENVEWLYYHRSYTREKKGKK